MNRGLFSILMIGVLATVLLMIGILILPIGGQSALAQDVAEVTKAKAQIEENAPATIAEVRSRARILHETIHGTLQVVHRDFFREGERLKLPSRSLEDVFKELNRSYNVEIRWIAVNAKAMSVDHKPQGEFETNAVKAITSGKQEFESLEADSYRYAGAIRLSSQCLKCHAPGRTSNEDRAAGLVITMPLKQN